MSYSTLGWTAGLTRGHLSKPVHRPMQGPVSKPASMGPTRFPMTLRGMGLQGFTPGISQLAQFLENYKGYVLAFSAATNSVAAYPQGMGKPAFKIQLSKSEPTDAGLSKARAMIDAKTSGLGNYFNQRAEALATQARVAKLPQANHAGAQSTGFNPHLAWGSRYAPAAFMGWRSGNGRSQGVPFYAGMMGLGTAVPIVLDPPIEQQEIRFDAPSMTIYMGSNKIALIPALISALAVKVILLGGSKVSAATSFWKASDKAARKVART